ncbi:CD1871A family CXXC motif-containing protein [Anaerococcus ihuae]|nr:CD1871A family CXXC motif-containing protein [Anaerococcus ihuae]
MQIGFLALALVFVIYGAFRGEVDTVLSKAIKLCLECVGIG